MIYKKCLKWIKEIKREIFKNELKLYLIINNDSFGVFSFSITVEFFMITYVKIKIFQTGHF